MGPMCFDFGFGPFRWVCTSSKPEDLDTTDRIAMEVLEEIAGFLDQHTDLGKHYEFGKMLEEFRRSLWRELDYRQEARNLSTLGANLLEFPEIVVPRGSFEGGVSKR